MIKLLQRRYVSGKLPGMGMIMVMALVGFFQVSPSWGSSKSRIPVSSSTSNFNITVTATGGVLTCNATAVILNAVTNAVSPVYSWTGPNGFVSSSANPGVTTPGVYTVVVTDGSGQMASASATVTQNIAAPGAFAAVNGTLSCAQTSVVLTGSSTTPGVTYRWMGPNGFLSTSALTVVTMPGIYTLAVTNPVNGCLSIASVSVQQNIVIPTVSVSVSAVLTCSQTSVVLTGSSTTPGVTYLWNGPAGFSSASQNTITTLPGTYTLVVTSPVTGCSSVKAVTVQQNIAMPVAIADVSGVITCDDPVVTLLGNSNTPGVIYQWMGPDGFFSTEQNPLTTIPGLYTLSVTNVLNGCTAVALVQVTADDCLTAGIAAARATSNEPSAAVSLYPNPVNTNGTITFTAPGSGHVKVEVYNLYNVKVATLFENQVLAGTTYTVNFDASSFNKGMYLYKITGAGISKQERLAVE